MSDGPIFPIHARSAIQVSAVTGHKHNPEVPVWAGESEGVVHIELVSHRADTEISIEMRGTGAFNVLVRRIENGSSTFTSFGVTDERFWRDNNCIYEPDPADTGDGAWRLEEAPTREEPPM